ncbi:MAG: ABC transporter substrate-binding protein [Sphaerochaetaceae bacterium]
MQRFVKTVFTIGFLTLVLATSIFAQAATEQPAAAVLSAIDAKGRTVESPTQPHRIVVAGKAAIMPADALFLFPEARQADIVLAKTDQGLGDFFNLLDSAFIKEKRISHQASVEELIALKPDLVVTKTSNYESVAKKMEAFGIPCFVMDLESSEAWKNEILELGKLLGNTPRAQEVVAQFEQRENSVTVATGTLSDTEKPSVLVMQVAASDGVTAFTIAPATWIQTQIVQKAGGIAAWLGAELSDNAWKKVSFEQIATWNPDYIYIISYKAPADSFIKEMKGSAQWQQLKAVQNNAIKAFPADNMSYAQSDTRWLLALQWLAADLHPQLYPGFDMEREITSFYRNLYGIEDQNVINQLLDLYRHSVSSN